MNEFSVMLFSLKSSAVFSINGEESLLNDICSKFLSCFEYKIDHENFIIKVDALQKSTTILKSNIDLFVNIYKEVNPRINRLPNFFGKLDENEFFYMLPGVKELSASQIISISNHLLSCNNKDIDFAEIQAQYNDLFSKVFDNYEIVAHPTDRKVKIGEGLKNKRICRFCLTGVIKMH